MKYKLSHPQKRIWYVDKMYGCTSIHNIAGFMKIHTSLDEARLERAIISTIEENDALLLRFDEENGRPYQYIEKDHGFVLEVVDYSGCLNQVDQKILTFAKEPFILSKELPFRIKLVKLAVNEYYLVIVMHHIISDGWTINLFTKKICDAYESDTETNDGESYMYYLDVERRYMESERFKKSKIFWSEKFSSLPENDLLLSNDIHSKRQVFTIDHTGLQKIKALTNKHHISLNTLFIIVKSLFDYKISHKTDVTYGIPVLNRSGHVLKNTLGMFTSTMPIRVLLSGETKLSDLFKDVVKSLKGCILNQRYPYDLLFDDLELRKKGYESLFDTCINYYVAQAPKVFNGGQVESEQIFLGEQAYSLQMVIEECEDQLNLSYDYKVDLFTDENITDMHETIIQILDQLCHETAETVKEIELINPGNKLAKIDHFTGPIRDKNDMTTLDAFKKVVASSPESVAIYESDSVLTYKELDTLCNRYANFLQAEGIGKRDIIGLQMPHSSHLIALILGVLKCGAAFLPITPDYPIERVKYMLEHSKAKVLISNKTTLESVKCLDAKDILLNTFGEEFINQSVSNDLAYILYTSGSTGNPKGVMVSNKNLFNYANWAGKTYLTQDDIFAFYSSISFDLTITSIFAPLLAGGSIDVYDDSHSDFILKEVVEKNRATVIKMTPSHLRAVCNDIREDSKVKCLILGGENLTRELASKVNKKIKVYNEYGPTEATVGCMIHLFDETTDLDTSVPIGLPIDNTRLLILNQDKNMVPNNYVGELYIAGSGVTKGYINNPDLTKESFVTIEDTLYYKTGDLCRYLKSGKIEYLSRKDNQLKIRGHRIELDEIRQVVSQQEGVVDVYINVDQNLNICAYMVQEDVLDFEEVKENISHILPAYMMPRFFYVLDNIPLTKNGKVDTKKLPTHKKKTNLNVACQGEVESLLSSICQSVLMVDSISMVDNFFELGGDSIKAIQISSKMLEFGYDLKVKDIMSENDFRSMARKISESKSEIKAHQGLVKGQQMPLPIQDWFVKQNFSDMNHYTQSVLLEIDQNIGVDVLEACFNQLLNQHDALRLNFDGKAFHYYDYSQKTPLVQVYDMRGLNKVQTDNRFVEVSNCLRKSIDISKGLLIRCGLYESRAKNHLFIAIHHLAVDGISWRILIDDLSNLLKNKDYLSKKTKTSSYQEWSEELHNYQSKSLESEVDWTFASKYKNRLKLGGMPGNPINKSVFRRLERSAFEKITNELLEDYKLKNHESLIYVLATAVEECYKASKFQVELEHHGRSDLSNHMDVSRTLGWFTTMYPVEIHVDENPMNTINALKETLRYYEKHARDYMLHDQSSDDGNRIRFNYLGDFSEINTYDNLSLSPLKTGHDVAERNISSALFEVNIILKADFLEVDFVYNTSKVACHEMELFADRYMDKLTSLLESLKDNDAFDLSMTDFEDLDMSAEDFENLFN